MDWSPIHRMFAICTMLSSVNTAANEHAAIASPVSAARNHSRINQEKKALCTQGLRVLRAAFGHRARVSFQPRVPPPSNC